MEVLCALLYFEMMIINLFVFVRCLIHQPPSAAASLQLTVPQSESGFISFTQRHIDAQVLTIIDILNNEEKIRFKGFQTGCVSPGFSCRKYTVLHADFLPCQIEAQYLQKKASYEEQSFLLFKNLCRKTTSLGVPPPFLSDTFQQACSLYIRLINLL